MKKKRLWRVQELIHRGSYRHFQCSFFLFWLIKTKKAFTRDTKILIRTTTFFFGAKKGGEIVGFFCNI